MSWTKNLNVFGDLVGKQHGERIREAALNVMSNVTYATPVGHPDLWKHPAPPGYVGGTARANWQASLDTAAEGVVDAQDSDGAPTIDRAKAVIDKAPNFAVIVLANNLPYIRALNYGLPEGHRHTVQAPLHFVETALEEVAREL